MPSWTDESAQPNKNKPDAYKKFSQWWRQALPRVQAQVQERLDAAGATHEAKLAARASVADFVVKMNKVTLHNADVIAEGEELMNGGVGAARHAAWTWPAVAWWEGGAAERSSLVME